MIEIPSTKIVKIKSRKPLKAILVNLSDDNAEQRWRCWIPKRFICASGFGYRELIIPEKTKLMKHQIDANGYEISGTREPISVSEIKSIYPKTIFEIKGNEFKSRLYSTGYKEGVGV